MEATLKGMVVTPQVLVNIFQLNFSISHRHTALGQQKDKELSIIKFIKILWWARVNISCVVHSELR